MSLSWNEPWNWMCRGQRVNLRTWPCTSTSQHESGIFMSQAEALPLHHNRHLKQQSPGIHLFFISLLHARVKTENEDASCQGSEV